MPHRDEPTGRIERLAIVPRPEPVTRKPMRSRPDDLGEIPIDYAERAQWLEAKMAILESYLEREHDTHEATKKEIQAVRAELAAVKEELAGVRLAYARLVYNYNALAATVGSAPNDAAGLPGSGMAKQLAELVSANRHAIRAGAVTGGGIVAVAQVCLWIFEKVLHG